MKYETDWWGVVFIPEDADDLVALQRIPPKAARSYETGSYDNENNAAWFEDPDDIAGLTDAEAPLGKVLIIRR